LQIYVSDHGDFGDKEIGIIIYYDLEFMKIEKLFPKDDKYSDIGIPNNKKTYCINVSSNGLEKSTDSSNKNMSCENMSVFKTYCQ
jgi:hypothetical protein